MEATDVASVSSAMPIDAYGRLNSSPAVSNILCNIASITSGEVDEKVGISRTDSGDMAENTSLLWHFDFIENKRPMNEYAHGIWKYGRMSLSWIDFYKRDWIGNDSSGLNVPSVSLSNVPPATINQCQLEWGDQKCCFELCKTTFVDINGNNPQRYGKQKSDNDRFTNDHQEVTGMSMKRFMAALSLEVTLLERK